MQIKDLKKAIWSSYEGWWRLGRTFFRGAFLPGTWRACLARRIQPTLPSRETKRECVCGGGGEREREGERERSRDREEERKRETERQREKARDGERVWVRAIVYVSERKRKAERAKAGFSRHLREDVGREPGADRGQFRPGRAPVHRVFAEVVAPGAEGRGVAVLVARPWLLRPDPNHLVLHVGVERGEHGLLSGYWFRV